jgi:predicted acetyltransferase
MSDNSIRAVTEDEYPAFVGAVAFQFAEDIHPDDVAAYRPVTELDRTRAVFEGDRIVATAETLTFRMAVPGGPPVACGGLTSVGVRTTHRRQGLLTALMREHLADARDRGEPVTALYASEAPIYGRFGYGPAVPSIRFELARHHAVLRDDVDVRGVDFVDPMDDRAGLVAAYDRLHPTVPGMMGRDDRWWELYLGEKSDEERHRKGYSSRFTAALEDRGYVTYRVKEGWTDNAPDNELLVTELIAADDDAYAALWQFVCSVDLVTRIKAGARPPDEPLPHMLVDSARFVARHSEPMYVRLLDLPAAMEARTYGTRDALVLDVDDPFWPDNSGRWLLDGGTDGAECRRTDDAPDLSLGTAELATAYLGGVRLSTLAHARRVVEHTPGAVQRADALFGAQRAPWNARIF